MATAGRGWLLCNPRWRNACSVLEMFDGVLLCCLVGVGVGTAGSHRAPKADGQGAALAPEFFQRKLRVGPGAPARSAAIHQEDRAPLAQAQEDRRPGGYRGDLIHSIRLFAYFSVIATIVMPIIVT